MTRRIFSILCLPLLAIGCDSQPDPPLVAAGSPGESMEYQLEIRLHRRLAAVRQQKDSFLSAFATDGCSGGLSVGWEYLANTFAGFREKHGNSPAWEDCCIEHDRTYHDAGGRDLTAEDSFLLREAADLQLKRCVLRTGTTRGPQLMLDYNLSSQEVEKLYQHIAELMYRAVRLGGVPCSGLPWRWGYGWQNCGQ